MLHNFLLHLQLVLLLKKEVLEEKYITLIGELVAYHDLRRTGNSIGVPNKLTGVSSATGYPQRFLYPQNEVDTNSNVPSSTYQHFSQTTTLFN